MKSQPTTIIIVLRWGYGAPLTMGARPKST